MTDSTRTQAPVGEIADGEARPSVLARPLIGLVRAYQLVVSPWFAPTCRYYPSCSAYAVGALRRHGVVYGTALAVWRVLRCNPWSRGGVDHVPEQGGGARTLFRSIPVDPMRTHHDGADRDLT